LAGLCVSASFDGRRTASQDVGAMARAAPHRGDDGTGTWSGDGVALVHQRLVVLPEDAQCPQPLVQGSLVLVADARLDNRDELVPQLVRSGYLVDAGEVPDAEVLLAAYRAWGTACPGRLVGDFAFVVWDDRRRRLVAARDPMGMRALHYRWEPRRRLLLATEVKQVLAADGVPRELDEAALAATLTGPYLPATWTAFAGVAQLAPGHVLEADASGCRTRLAWRPDPTRRFAGGLQDAAEAFREVLGEAVRARLRCAGPVGVWLSGGMDSGSLASTAGLLRERGAVPADTRLHSYSWAFSDLPDSDERTVSDHIVRRFGLTGTDVQADDGWPLAGYPEHGPDEDDPFCWVYQALVERTVDRGQADGVRLLLSGDRGDEVTGDWVFDELGLLIAGQLGPAAADLHLAGPTPWAAARRAGLQPLVQRTLPGLVAHRTRNRAPWPAWVRDGFARRTGLADLVAESQRLPAFGGPARSARHHRVFSPQSARIAVLRDRTRARRGIGFADPYSDRRLVELVLSLPQWQVQRRSDAKALARHAMVGVMPEQARTAAAKTIPVSLYDRGLRERAVPVVEALLTGSQAAARGWLDEGAAQAAYHHYVRTGESPVDDLWWVLSTEMWLRRWWT
jgi:asparagine synthase (glutamine-hydrolysing)